MRGYAVSLGALAMGLVVLRGALFGQHAADVAIDAIIALVVFAAVGWVAGWIADFLVRDSTEQMFRARVDWYRSGLVEVSDNDSESATG